MNSTKQKISIKNYPDEVISDKWRNLYFDKDGGSHIGGTMRASEVEAAQFGAEFIEQIKEKYSVMVDGTLLSRKSGIPAEHPGKQIKIYSYHIQVPVKS